MGSGGIILLVLFAVSWIVQAIVAQANKKKEQERLAELARRRREQEAMRGQPGAGTPGTTAAPASTPTMTRSAPIPQPFGMAPTSTTSGRPGDDLAARRAEQIEALRRRREAQLEQMRRRQASSPAPAQPGAPPTSRPSTPPGVSRPSSRPQSKPAGTSPPTTFPAPTSSPVPTGSSRPMPQTASGSRPKRKEKAAEPVAIDAAYAQPESSVAATAPTRTMVFDSSSLRDPDGIRRAFVLKELLDAPLALRPSDQDRLFAW